MSTLSTMPAAPPASASLSRTERNQRDKLRRITRAARRLFGRKGFERTTTREIAHAADIGAGTLFLYVSSKEDLLVMIFRDEVGRAIDEAFASMRPAPLLDQLMQVFNAMISHHERNFALARLFVKDLPFVDDRARGVGEVMARLYARMRDLIERAKERGELRADVPAGLLAENLFGLFFQAIQLWLGRRKTPAQRCRAHVREKLELQLAGLRAASPRGGKIRTATGVVRAAPCEISIDR
jgi:TetR/AcrR family transcriptional regulator, cholesterol catabolism regulator